MAHRFVALLRGINVGGHNILSMADLRMLVAECGGSDVESYIQSGNVIFSHDNADAAGFSARLQAAIGSRFGFEPSILSLAADQYRAAMDAVPFFPSDPKHLHLYFMAAPPPDPDLVAIENDRGENEAARLIGAIFYLHAPDGVARSRLATTAEKHLGVPATARNWRTAQKIAGFL